MNQLITDSTSLTSQSEELPSTPTDTGHLDRSADFPLAVVWPGTYFSQGPSVQPFTTATRDFIGGWGHSNLTGGPALLWTNLSRFTDREQVILIGSQSTVLDQEDPRPEGSTADEGTDPRIGELLVDYFKRLVHDSVDEVFVDGMESALSKGINVAVETFGESAVTAIEKLLGTDGANVEVVGEILRQLGSIEDPWTHYRRLSILTDNLKSTDPRIRDAAAIGIAALDDPAATDAIRGALDQESSLQLQGNLRLVLDQLQATQNDTFLEDD